MSVQLSERAKTTDRDARAGVKAEASICEASPVSGERLASALEILKIDGEAGGELRGEERRGEETRKVSNFGVQVPLSLQPVDELGRLP